jgi:hypothetical protein
MNTEHTTPYRSPAPDTARSDFLHPARRDPSLGPVAAAGLFPGTPAGARIAPQESAMNEDRTYVTSRHTARFAILIVGLFLALAIGAPWLLNDAPPSPEAVFVAKLCCATAPNALAPGTAPRIAPAQ